MDEVGIAVGAEVGDKFTVTICADTDAGYPDATNVAVTDAALVVIAVEIEERDTVGMTDCTV